MSASTIIILLVASHAAVFILGALVFRNNSKKADKIVTTVEDVTKKV